MAFFKSPTTWQNIVENVTALYKRLLDIEQDTIKGQVVFVSKYNKKADFDDLPEAYASLSSTGGTIILDNIKVGDTPYTGNIEIQKTGVSIIGVTAPIYNLTTSTIENDTPVIEGIIYVRKTGFQFENAVVIDPSANCLHLLKSGATPASNHTAHLSKLVLIGGAYNSAFHGLLIEDYDNVTGYNIVTDKHAWGIALKSNNIYINGVQGKDHNFGGLITKADFSKTVENVRVDNIDYFSTQICGGVWIQNYSATSKLKNVIYNNIRIKNGTLRISNENGSPTDGLDDITITNISVNNTVGTSLPGMLLGNLACSGRIIVSNFTCRGAINSINDASLVFSNLSTPNLNVDGVVYAKFLTLDRTLGFTWEKTGMTSGGSAVPVATVTYTGDHNTALEFTVRFQSSTIYGSGVYKLCQGWSNVTPSTNGFGTSTVGGNSVGFVVSATANTTTRVITISIIPTTTNAETGNLKFSVLPLSTASRITVTPL